MTHADGPPQLDKQTADAARAALAKRQAGKKLTRQEEAVLRRVQRDTEERNRRLYYRTIPKKHWVEMSGRQHKVLDQQARTYGVPLEGDSIDLYRVALWLHDFLAENGRKLLAADDEDSLLGGDASTPALERLRAAKADLAQLDLAERRGQLVSREKVHQGLAAIAAIFRHFGEQLQKQYGRDAAELLDDTLADAERAIDRLFDGPAPAADDPPDPDAS